MPHNDLFTFAGWRPFCSVKLQAVKGEKRIMRWHQSDPLLPAPLTNCKIKQYNFHSIVLCRRMKDLSLTQTLWNPVLTALRPQTPKHIRSFFPQYTDTIEPKIWKFTSYVWGTRATRTRSLSLGGWNLAEWSERCASIPKITGSNPSGGSKLTFRCWLREVVVRERSLSLPVCRLIRDRKLGSALSA
jgi:hypothetical protein